MMLTRFQVFDSSLIQGTAVASVIISTLVPGVVMAAPPAGDFALEQPADENTAQARAAYDEGEQAYRLGKFGEAATAFEQAYQLSDLPDILYNIGLAHLRWYDIEPDVAHLRKARVVFQNYVIEIQKDPELGDLDEANQLIAQIDEKIAEVDARDQDQVPGSSEPTDLGPDPGKKLRIGGAVAMGLGAALIVGGVVSGVVLGVQGQGFEADVTNAYADYEALGCMAGDVRPACDQVNDRITTYSNNGHTANALAVGLGLSLGGVGLIGLVTGAVLLVQGNKKTKVWEQRKLFVTPRWSPGGGGVGISGRF